MNNIKLEKRVIGNIGMYYVCYKLSCMGWNVMQTSRNAPGIDIVAYNKNGTKFIGIHVKTLSKRDAVILGNSLDKVMGDYMTSQSLRKRGTVLGMAMKLPTKPIQPTPKNGAADGQSC